METSLKTAEGKSAPAKEEVAGASRSSRRRLPIAVGMAVAAAAAGALWCGIYVCVKAVFK